MQRIDVEPKLAAADAILTPTSVDQPAYLVQITVAKRKSALSTAGVSAVQDALKAMYLHFSKATPSDAEAWTSKSPSPEVLYLVPPERFVRGPFVLSSDMFERCCLHAAFEMQDDFSTDPTSDPHLKRLIVNFLVSTVLGVVHLVLSRITALHLTCVLNICCRHLSYSSPRLR